MSAFFAKIIAFFMSILAFFGIGPKQPDVRPAPVEPEIVCDGAEFTVNVASNPSTGYHWEYKILKGDVVPANEGFISSVADKNIVGAGGTSWFLFKAKTDGEFSIEFSQYAPGKPELPVQTFVITGECVNGIVTACVAG